MSSPSNILHFYRYPGFCGPNQAKIQTSIKKQFPIVSSVETEFCFNVELESGKGGQTNAELSPPERETLMWLLRETFEPDMTREGKSYLDESKEKGMYTLTP